MTIELTMVPAEWVRRFGLGVIGNEPMPARRVDETLHIEGFKLASPLETLYVTRKA